MDKTRLKRARERKQRRITLTTQKPERKEAVGFFVARQTRTVYHELTKGGLYGFDAKTRRYDEDSNLPHVQAFLDSVEKEQQARRQYGDFADDSA
jgi:hypothetical protein